jgi:hypothetical protein
MGVLPGIRQNVSSGLRRENGFPSPVAGDVDRPRKQTPESKIPGEHRRSGIAGDR